MSGPGLPTNINAGGTTTGHKANSDTVHSYVNKLDTTVLTSSDNQLLSYDNAVGTFKPRDPADEDRWRPSDFGLLGWSTPLVYLASSTTLTSGTVTLAKVPIRRSVTITNLHLHVVTAGSSFTANNSNVGVYDSSGTRIAESADQAASWASAGYKSIALNTPVAVTGGAAVFVWLAVKCTATTTIAIARTGGGLNAASMNAGLTVSTALSATAGNDTANPLPASFTPSSNSFNNSYYWFGYS